MRFIRATLDSGEQIVSRFDGLASVHKFAQQVFSGVRPFIAYAVVSETHPASGEAVLMRTRRFVQPSSVRALDEVIWVGEGAPNLGATTGWSSRVAPRAGRYGVWKVPEGETVEVNGVRATPGVEYPVRYDAPSRTRYVILQAAQPGSLAVIYSLNAAAPSASSGPVTEVLRSGDADDDMDN